MLTLDRFRIRFEQLSLFPPRTLRSSQRCSLLIQRQQRAFVLRVRRIGLCMMVSGDHDVAQARIPQSRDAHRVRMHAARQPADLDFGLPRLIYCTYGSRGLVSSSAFTIEDEDQPEAPEKMIGRSLRFPTGTRSRTQWDTRLH